VAPAPALPCESAEPPPLPVEPAAPLLPLFVDGVQSELLEELPPPEAPEPLEVLELSPPLEPELPGICSHAVNASATRLPNTIVWNVCFMLVSCGWGQGTIMNAVLSARYRKLPPSPVGEAGHSSLRSAALASVSAGMWGWQNPAVRQSRRRPRGRGVHARSSNHASNASQPL
jgi:hypothetical protein